MKKYWITIITLTIISFSSILKAQTVTKQAIVKITGEVTNPLELKLSDLQQFIQTEVTRKEHDGKDHIFSGVILASILQKAGVTLGKELRGKNLTKYVLVDASDGYQVIFALAELDKDFTDRIIILADKEDGKLLPVPIDIQIKLHSALDTLLAHINNVNIDSTEIISHGSKLSQSVFNSFKGIEVKVKGGLKY